MWTAEHRRAADRRGLRYPSDLTEAEWALVAPFVGQCSRSHQCNLLRAVDGLPMERPTQGPAAEKHGA